MVFFSALSTITYAYTDFLHLLHLDTTFQDQPVIEYDLEAKLVVSTQKLFLDLFLRQNRIDIILLIH